MLSDPKKIEELNKFMKRVAEFETKGQPDKAIDELERARKSFPDDGNLLNRLGDLYVRVNKIREAVNAYETGVNAYREDTFYRNAIGLGKKVLRYDPENLEMQRVVAELFTELGQRADAATYFLAYLERLEKNNKIDDAVNVCKRVLSMGLSDPLLLKKIDDIYSAAGLKDKKRIDVREVIRLKEEPLKEEIRREEQVVEKAPTRTEPPIKAEERKPVVSEIKEPVRVTREIANFKELGDVVEKSIGAFSEHQKNAIGILHKSLEHQVASLVKIVDDLKTSSTSSIRETEKLIVTLRETIASFSQREDTTLRNMTTAIKDSVEKLARTVSTSVETQSSDTRRYTTETKNAIEDLSNKLEELKNIANITAGMSTGVKELNANFSKLENFLLSYFLRHEAFSKKNRTFIIIMTACLCTAVVLLLILASKR